MHNPLLLLILAAALAVPAAAQWPNAPYIDTCSGMLQNQCSKTSYCSWFEINSPNCYNTNYEAQYPPLNLQPPNNIVSSFFTFSYGSHLSEGSINAIYYNYNVTECALECMRAANPVVGTSRRCMSFDFYPFEAPIAEAPYFESLERGVCALNTANRNSGRLRNEDQGWTDAELYYGLSHFTKRPFSNLDGYYEIRDPRGGAIAEMLNYILATDVITTIIWGGSRWGISHLSVPQPISTTYACKGPNVVNSGRLLLEEEQGPQHEARSGTVGDAGDGLPFAVLNVTYSDTDTHSGRELKAKKSPTSHATAAPTQPQSPVFFGGYTPVGISQRCPGMMTKTAAAALCASTGGFLCASQSIISELNGRKLGCSLDGWPTWSAADTDSGQTKFVRCCASYGLVNQCSAYVASNVAKCASYSTFNECVAQGSGSALQQTEGFGHLLASFRASCASGKGACKGLVRDWAPRDACIWCLDPNSALGQCRPGGDYGICPTVPASQQALFALAVQSQCGPSAICELTNAFPDLDLLLGVPTTSPTRAPTAYPTAPSLPSASPTPAPPKCATAAAGTKTKAQYEAACNSATYAPYCRWLSGQCVARSKASG